MKARKEDFTSTVSLLIKAGHRPMKIKLEKSVAGALKAKRDYVWFPALQIIVSVDTNTTYQCRRDDEGWYLRLNRKNPWHAMKNARGGPEFEKLIEPYYVNFLNNMMMGEFDAAKPEGRGVQSGGSPQAT